jgi:transcription antitermination factor NusG
MLDLFGNAEIGDFRWAVAIFQGSGATEVIQRANEVELHTYYPIRINKNGEPVPLWKNYLFVEFHEQLTLSICRSTFKFMRLISTHDEEGILKPVLVPKNAIDENLRLLRQGKFNDKSYRRRFYGRGSLVKVIDGIFTDKRVKLETDLPSHIPGNKMVAVSIGGWNGKIEIFKLAL